MKVELPLSDEVRKGQSGIRLTKSLFVDNVGDGAPFTLKRYDHRGALSLYKLYMKHYGDPTEYTFAMEVFGDWEHWEMLLRSHFFKPFIEDWRRERDIKIMSDMYNALVTDAMYGGKSSPSSAKYLLDKLDRSEKDADKRKSKREEVLSPVSTLREDFERISVAKVN